MPRTRYFSSILCGSLLSHYLLGLLSLFSGLAAFKKKISVSPRFAWLREKNKNHLVPFSNISKSLTDTSVLLILEKGRMWLVIFFPVNIVPRGPTFGGKHM